MMSVLNLADPELEAKTKKATERLSENMHIVANEPSLAFFRVQEHVRKALPPMVEKRMEVSQLHQHLQGHIYDIEYAIGAIKSFDGADSSFKHIQEMMKSSIFVRQQLKYEENRKKSKEGSSVYKRLSAHITLDLPDLPEFSDAIRETANKVESIMTSARQTSSQQ
ncbi:unnamed protein product [Bemisia tabaci]|uniref:Uncharacterized protein n=1 Tax=Bemisia tabaci TaxID=7038 RepID=A0A9P0A014_BEMTA|nr:PREDICTED: BLOC-1-related complex subunit 8 homolog [Bemisia tabaci]CAH0380477.1 unnamed protein product [Bemisia tabaci]